MHATLLKHHNCIKMEMRAKFPAYAVYRRKCGKKAEMFCNITVCMSTMNLRFALIDLRFLKILLPSNALRVFKKSKIFWMFLGCFLDSVGCKLDTKLKVQEFLDTRQKKWIYLNFSP